MSEYYDLIGKSEYEEFKLDFSSKKNSKLFELNEKKSISSNEKKLDSFENEQEFFDDFSLINNLLNSEVGTKNKTIKCNHNLFLQQLIKKSSINFNLEKRCDHPYHHSHHISSCCFFHDQYCDCMRLINLNNSKIKNLIYKKILNDQIKTEAFENSLKQINFNHNYNLEEEKKDYDSTNLQIFEKHGIFDCCSSKLNLICKKNSDENLMQNQTNDYSFSPLLMSKSSKTSLDFCNSDSQSNSPLMFQGKINEFMKKSLIDENLPVTPSSRFSSSSSSISKDLLNLTTSTKITNFNENCQISEKNKKDLQKHPKTIPSINRHDLIKNLCTSLDDLNQSNEKIFDSTKTFSLDSLKNQQICFFKKIFSIISKFIKLNNYLVFKLNNNFNLDLNSFENFETTSYSFKKFDQFVQSVKPLIEWLTKNNYNIENNLNETEEEKFIKYKLNNESTKMDSSPKDQAKSNKEKNLMENFCSSNFFINKKTKRAKQAKSKNENIQKNFEKKIEFKAKEQESGNLTDSEIFYCQAELSETFDMKDVDKSINKQDEINIIEDKCKSYEKIINDLQLEIKILKKKQKIYNSKDFKIMARHEYEALKFQVKAFRDDYNLEHTEKIHLFMYYQEKIEALENFIGSNLKTNTGAIGV